MGANFKVCILTAGSGSRLLPLTGSINKSILPVGDKAAISRIVEKFNTKTEFVIATGYQEQTVKTYLSMAHPENIFEFVTVDYIEGPGSGPGYSLLKCRDLLECPFIFVACDTLVLQEIPGCEENWIGISQVQDPLEFCTAKISEDNVEMLIDKSKTGTNDAFIGLAGIHDHELFFEGLEQSNKLINNELQISSGLNEIIKKSQLKVRNFTWHDTGSIESYKKANAHFSKDDFDFSKSDEYIYFVNKKVIKFFANQQIAEQRYTRSINLAGFVPEILSFDKNFYMYNFTDGNVLYNCDIEDLSDGLFKWLNDEFWSDVSLSDGERREFRQRCHSFYYEKTYDRISLFQKREKNSLFYKANINGKSLPEVSELLQEINWENLVEGLPSRFHGDLQFDNIIFSEKEGFKLIDWRQDFAGITSYGDRYYDFSKLLGGIIISYREIKSGSFEFNFSERSITYSLPIYNKAELVENKYIDFLQNLAVDVDKVHVLTALIFLNMAPLHAYPFSHLLFALGRERLHHAVNTQKSL